eukprot:184220_1
MNHLTWTFWLFIYFNVSLSYFFGLDANYNADLVIGRYTRFKDDMVSLSNGQNTVLSYSFQPTTTSATLTYFHVSFPSPTHTTSTPAQVTPVPTNNRTQSPILPGAPTSSPIKTPTIKTPPNNPIKTPTQSPVLPPGTPTKAPVTLHPIQIGTAKPRALTDDQVTARQTQPTQSATKQPTSQGATNWDCVSWGIFIIKWTKYSIIVFISTNNYKSSINMFCVSLPSPTHATSTPTQETPVPTDNPTQSPILPVHLLVRSPIKTPTNNPSKTPTQMALLNQSLLAHTDDLVTARPTTKGATDWDCVSISGLDGDNLNGNYNKLSDK